MNKPGMAHASSNEGRSKHNAAHCLHTCLGTTGKPVHHGSYAGASPIHSADCEKQAKRKVMGAGSCHSGAGESSLETHARFALLTNVCAHICLHGRCRPLGSMQPGQDIMVLASKLSTTAGLVNRYAAIMSKGQWLMQTRKVLNDLHCIQI